MNLFLVGKPREALLNRAGIGFHQRLALISMDIQGTGHTGSTSTERIGVVVGSNNYVPGSPFWQQASSAGL